MQTAKQRARTHREFVGAGSTEVRARVPLMRTAPGPVLVFTPAFIDFVISFSRLFVFLAFTSSQHTLSLSLCALVSLSLSLSLYGYRSLQQKQSV